MTGTPQALVHPSKEAMAQATADRLVDKIVRAQRERGSASVVLTGGRNGNGVLAALAGSAGRGAVDWSHLDLWWGDERYLPEGDAERNDTQARAAVLDSLPLDPARVHTMPCADGPHGADVDAAAAAYAEELRFRAPGGAAVPCFDVLLLGVGPDTHIASLFPESVAVREAERYVVGVRGAPKPPPTRISLTLPAIRAARELWLLAAGRDKAPAVATVLAGAPEVEAPAAGAYGAERTLWLLDSAAAQELPEGLAEPVPASPRAG